MYGSRTDLLVFPNGLGQVSSVVSPIVGPDLCGCRSAGLPKESVKCVKWNGLRTVVTAREHETDVQYLVLIMSMTGSRAFEFCITPLHGLSAFGGRPGSKPH